MHGGMKSAGPLVCVRGVCGVCVRVRVWSVVSPAGWFQYQLIKRIMVCLYLFLIPLLLHKPLTDTISVFCFCSPLSARLRHSCVESVPLLSFRRAWPGVP